MSEGLSPEQSEEAARLGEGRKQWGELTAEAMNAELAAREKADGYKGVGKILHRSKAESAAAEADRAGIVTSAAEAGNKVSERNALEHYKQNEDAYRDQANIDNAVRDAEAED